MPDRWRRTGEGTTLTTHTLMRIHSCAQTRTCAHARTCSRTHRHRTSTAAWRCNLHVVTHLRGVDLWRCIATFSRGARWTTRGVHIVVRRKRLLHATITLWPIDASRESRQRLRTQRYQLSVARCWCACTGSPRVCERARTCEHTWLVIRTPKRGPGCCRVGVCARTRPCPFVLCVCSNIAAVYPNLRLGTDAVLAC